MPLITERFIAEMRGIVGREHVLASRAMSELYSYDASLARGQPGLVVFPADEQEVTGIVRAAGRAGVPFVPRGFGTNLSGGTVTVDQGMVICLTRLNRILGVYPESRQAVVQTGVTNLELQEALASRGYFYAPDPASQKVSTLGGNVGENSGGPRCLKYGVTTNHVLGMRVVLPDGAIVNVGGAALDPPGYDLRGVLVGSEGTLGIVTEMTLRILPQAEHVITMLAVYDAIADAARAVSGIVAAGIVPSTLEMMDATIIRAVEDSTPCGYPRDAAAVLIIEVEGPAAGLPEQAQRIGSICWQNRCRTIREAKDKNERNRLWQGRRGAFGAIARLAPNYLVNDASVPRTKLPQALAKVAEIAHQYGFVHGNVFHAGDGNLHPLLLFDSRDEGQLHRVEKAGWEIIQACVDLGGTISGEHGIGREKRQAMRLVCAEADLEIQRRLKRAFDPDDVLNPGKVLPASRDAEPRTDVPRVRDTSDPGGAVADVAERIRQAGSRRQGILPKGGGNRSQCGNLPRADSVVLDSSALPQVIEYDPPNQVVTVGAGMPLGALQRHLQAHQQWLPVRPAFVRDSSTVGGLVALGSSGPERLLYGAPRDLLLGLCFVNSGGEQISVGGRVVKNVTGYDMTRLMTGSLGTLGFITAATWRLLALPERCVALAAEGPLDRCAATALRLLQSKLVPAFATCVPGSRSTPRTSDNGWSLVVGFEGFPQTVEYQLDNCGRLLQEDGLEATNRTDYPVHEGPFGAMYERMATSPFILRGDFPPDAAAEALDALDRVVPLANVLVDVGCGRIVAGVEELSEEQWCRSCAWASERGGHVLLEKASDDFRERQDVFGLPHPAWKIMHRIKAQIDPDNVFAPGRLPGKV